MGPSEYPDRHAGLVTGIVVVGIFGGIFVHKLFLVVALAFWFVYTAILSYVQFRNKHKYSYKTFTEALLNPQLRFFIFEYLAILGILSVYKFGILVGILSLVVWWLFSFNFFHYYKFRRKKRKR